MKELVLYIHGKGGCSGESDHYRPMFPECEVVGLDYQTFTPWETGKEIREAVKKLDYKRKEHTGRQYAENGEIEASLHIWKR